MNDLPAPVDWNQVAREIARQVVEMWSDETRLAHHDVILYGCWARGPIVHAVFRHRPQRYGESAPISGRQVDPREGDSCGYFSSDPAHLAYDMLTFWIVEPDRYAYTDSSAGDAIHWRFARVGGDDRPARTSELRALQSISEEDLVVAYVADVLPVDP